MSGIADFARNKILDQVFSATDNHLTLGPATLYFSLTTATALVTDTGTTIKFGGSHPIEPDPTAVTGSYVGYLRATSTNNATNWPAASSGSKTNAAVSIDFPASTGGSASPVTVTTFAVTDNTYANGGNLFAFGALGVTKSIANGDTPKIAIAAATFTLA